MFQEVERLKILQLFGLPEMLVNIDIEFPWKIVAINFHLKHSATQ